MGYGILFMEITTNHVTSSLRTIVRNIINDISLHGSTIRILNNSQTILITFIVSTNPVQMTMCLSKPHPLTCQDKEENRPNTRLEAAANPFPRASRATNPTPMKSKAFANFD